jgi:O-antigen/teichoic acid export membrane protein
VPETITRVPHENERRGNVQAVESPGASGPPPRHGGPRRTPTTARLKRHFEFLSGTGVVGVVSLLGGGFTYVFLSLAGRTLDPQDFGSISTLWAAAFIVGPGLFLPVQQEVGRLIAHPTWATHAVTPVRSALVLILTLLTASTLAVLLANGWMTRHLFSDHGALTWCFLGAVASYGAMFLARGALSGLGRFGAFSMLLFLESGTRAVFALGFAAAGMHDANAFGIAIAVAPLISAVVVTRFGSSIASTFRGKATPLRELAPAFGWLLVASLFAQFLTNAGPIAVQLLAGPGRAAEAGRFLSALVVCRVTLYLLQAVQATLLPNLTTLAEGGRFREFRLAIRNLILVCLALIVVSTIGAALIGPEIVSLLFGDQYAIGRGAMAMLACASSVFILASAMNGAAIAVGGHSLTALAWGVGSVAFVVCIALIGDLFLRVEVGYLAGSVVASAVLLAWVPAAVRKTSRAAAASPVSVDPLLETPGSVN